MANPMVIPAPQSTMPPMWPTRDWGWYPCCISCSRYIPCGLLRCGGGAVSRGCEGQGCRDSMRGKFHRRDLRFAGRLELAAQANAAADLAEPCRRVGVDAHALALPPRWTLLSSLWHHQGGLLTLVLPPRWSRLCSGSSSRLLPSLGLGQESTSLGGDWLLEPPSPGTAAMAEQASGSRVSYALA